MKVELYPGKRLQDFMMVEDFHKHFGLPVSRNLPQLLDPAVFAFRHKFLHEENRELAEAEDSVKFLDSLIDLVYVVHGTALFMGASYSNWLMPHLDEAVFEVADFEVANPVPDSLPSELREYLVRRIQLDLLAFNYSHNILHDVRRSLYHLHLTAHIAYTGAAILGFPWEEAWAAVHIANMNKVRASSDGSDSKRGSSWDVVKPDGWQSPEPQLKEILTKAGFTW